MVISMRNLLPSFLSSCIKRSRLIGPVLLRERHFRVQSIDRARGSPHDRRLRIRRLANLEEVNEPSDVAVDVGARVLHSVPDTGLSGEVHDVGERDDLEELLEEGGVVDVALDDEDAAALEEGLAGSLEGRVVVVVEVVEAEDAVAAAFQGGGDVSADETGGAGDEDGDAAGGAGADVGGGSDAFLPGGAAPGGGGAEGAAGGVGGGEGGGGGGGAVEEDEDEAEEDEGPEGELGGG